MLLRRRFFEPVRRVPQAKRARRQCGTGSRTGCDTCAATCPIRAVLVAVAILGFSGMPYTILVPVIRRNVLERRLLDLRLAFNVLRASGRWRRVYLASRPKHSRVCFSHCRGGRRHRTSMALFAFSMTVSRFRWLLMLITGMSIMLMAVSCNTLVQSLVPDDKRGRVMSLYSVAFMGLTPFGALIGGSIARHWGPTTAMLVCAAGCLTGALYVHPATCDCPGRHLVTHCRKLEARSSKKAWSPEHGAENDMEAKNV